MIKEVQEVLNIPVTGEFDNFTESAVKNFQLKNGLPATGVVDNETRELLLKKENIGFISTDLHEPFILNQEFIVKKVQIKEKTSWTEIVKGKKVVKEINNYFHGPTKKDSIFLHFTAGWDNPYSTITDWENDKRGEVCTQFVIGGRNGQTLEDKYNGEIVQCLEYGNYGWHLGIGNTAVHRNSIGIEVCSLGPLTKRLNDYYMWANKRVNPSEVIDLKREFRGHRYFHRINDTQLNSLKFLLEKIARDTGIDITKGMKERLAKYDTWKAFDFDQEIKDGRVKGLFCHTNVSPPNRWGGYEKWDWFPQPELIDLIHSL